MIKPIRKLASALLVLAWFLHPAGAQAATPAACTTSLASLNGWYAMLVSGTTLGTYTGKYLAGALFFNGAGGITADNVYGSSGSDSTATGSYVLNGDCTLTLTLDIGTSPAQVYTVAVRHSSNEAVGIEVDASAVATIDLQAQYASYVTGLNFTDASANGTFAASCYGAIATSSDLNLATFSNGTVSGTDPYDNGGFFVVADNPYTGTYSVNSDGTLAGTATVDGTTFDFFGVISNSGSELEYFYTNVAGNVATNAFASCVGGSVTAATAAPPVPVNLSSVDNVFAVANNGSSNAGIYNDDGYSYSANLLGTSLTWNGLTFTIGSPTSASGVTSAVIPLPAGNFSTLSLLGTGLNGNQLNQSFIVTYTDGTTTTLTQSLNDWGGTAYWGGPTTYPGESIVSTMAYRVIPGGATQNGPWFLYGYSFGINSAKTVASLTLPDNASVVVLAAVLSGSPALQPQTISFPAIPAQKVGVSLALSATATSGLPVSFASSTSSVCTVSGTTAAMIAPGTCTIIASQAGNSTYAAAPSVSQSFTVAAAASFTLSASPASVTIVPPVCVTKVCVGGNPAKDTITVTPANGFTGRVALSVTGLPAGVSGVFEPATVTASGTSSLVLTPSSSTPFRKSTTLTITGTSGSGASTITASTTITLNY
jgi:hypothetical protein